MGSLFGYLYYYSCRFVEKVEHEKQDPFFILFLITKLISKNKNFLEIHNGNC